MMGMSSNHQNTKEVFSVFETDSIITNNDKINNTTDEKKSPVVPLGIYTLNPLPENEKVEENNEGQSPETQSLQGFNGFQAVKQLEFANRLKKYYAKRLAVSILWNHSGVVLGTGEEFKEQRLNFHKVIKCMRVRHSTTVDVWMSTEHKKAFYGGLCTCSGVWVCPVCATKIQTRRRLEILAFFRKIYKEKAKQVAMVTFTFPHYITDTLEDSLSKQAEALRKFRSSDNFSWEEFKLLNGYGGLIRALEIMFGQNGWHPHTHELWVLDYWEEDLEREGKIKEYLLDRWRKACISAGLLDGTNARRVEDFNKQSLDIQFRVKDGEYVTKEKIKENDNWEDEKKAKWGADNEMTGGLCKVAKRDGMHPFQILLGTDKNLLKDARNKEEQATITKNIERYTKLFIEYTNGTKGKAQLFWTPGLKLLCGIAEKTDEQIMAEQEDNADVLASLEDKHWACVQKFGFDGALLDLAEKDDFEGLRKWFAQYNIELLPPTPISDEQREYENLIKQEKIAKEQKKQEFLAKKRIQKQEEKDKKTAEKIKLLEEKLAKRAITAENVRIKAEKKANAAIKRAAKEQEKLLKAKKK